MKREIPHSALTGARSAHASASSATTSADREAADRYGVGGHDRNDLLDARGLVLDHDLGRAREVAHRVPDAKHRELVEHATDRAHRFASLRDAGRDDHLVEARAR